MNFQIKDIKARQIIDSRGIPTIETDVILESGTIGRASVPSGASTGKFEAIELRDNNNAYYFGKSVKKAIENIEKVIKPLLRGEKVYNQREIDIRMLEKDGTKTKSKLGANAILSVSLACARAAAKENKLPLYKYLGGMFGLTMPIPMMNIINGGAHANNNLDFQEFMIQPVGACSISESIKMGAEVFYELKKLINSMGCATAVGDEGGFSPNFKSNNQAIETIIKAIENAGYTTEEIKICLDIAGSELYRNNKYNLRGEGIELNSREMIEYLKLLVNNYPINSIEDGLSEEDYTGWEMLTKELSSKCQLVGDDLFVTNFERLEVGINNHRANAILIKPNQTGTLTETINTVLMAQKNNYGVIISHRSGETEDTFISDLAVSVNAGQIKTGSISRGERTAKYNRLLRIEEDLKWQF